MGCRAASPFGGRRRDGRRSLARSRRASHRRRPDGPQGRGYTPALREDASLCSALLGYSGRLHLHRARFVRRLARVFVEGGERQEVRLAVVHRHEELARLHGRRDERDDGRRALRRADPDAVAARDVQPARRLADSSPHSTRRDKAAAARRTSRCAFACATARKCPAPSAARTGYSASVGSGTGRGSSKMNFAPGRPV